ncbi:chorismate mutase [Candidatus Bathyarchaeota archaeon]|jgi:chorismate mutase|nr:chorismate mutase [Candidatus Bathyarchaeota archaeon]
MDDIQHLRRRIDEIDDQILAALSERIKICKAIGDVKKKQGLAIKDPDRENQVFKRIKEKSAQFTLDPVQIEAVYREIVNICSAVQK